MEDNDLLISVNIMAADDLVMLGARASTAMLITQFLQYDIGPVW